MASHKKCVLPTNSLIPIPPLQPPSPTPRGIVGAEGHSKHSSLGLCPTRSELHLCTNSGLHQHRAQSSTNCSPHHSSACIPRGHLESNTYRRPAQTQDTQFHLAPWRPAQRQDTQANQHQRQMAKSKLKNIITEANAIWHHQSPALLLQEALDILTNLKSKTVSLNEVS